MHMGLVSSFFRYSWGVDNPWDVAKKSSADRVMTCAQQDTASMQVVLVDGEDFLLTISHEPAFWKGGRLPIYRLAVDCSLNTDIQVIGLIEDTDRILKSDPVLDVQTVFVEQAKVQQIWVECSTGKETLPGDYVGTVRLYRHEMFEDESLVGECHFTVTVKPITLPSSNEYQFHLDLFQHPSNIARYYHVPLWSDDHFGLLAQYLEAMGRLGQKAVSVFVSEIPYIGQRSYLLPNPSDMFEYSMVRTVKDNNGTFRYDFSTLDRYVDLASRYGIHDVIDVFGLLSIWRDDDAGYGPLVPDHPDTVRVRYFDEADQVYKYVRSMDALREFIQAAERHFIDQGWIERIRVIADEPSDVDAFRMQVARLAEIAPTLHTKVAINHVEFIQEDLPGVTDYVPLLTAVTAQYARLQALQANVSGKILYYVCCVPDFPNTFIGSPPLESRLIPWLVEKLGLDGFLRWSFTAWVERPYQDLQFRDWRFGDSFLVYPGNSGHPVLSLRYKWLLQGIRDYEVMQILKSQGKLGDVQVALDAVFGFKHPGALYNTPLSELGNVYSLQEEDYDRLWEGLS